MGTTGTVAAKLAGADGKTIYICGRTARGSIAAARAITPVMGTRGGIIYPNTGRPTPPNGLDRYPPGSIASPAEAAFRNVRPAQGPGVLNQKWQARPIGA
jgi:hypothetical protein